MFTRKPRLQLEKFAINGAKRLLQHNLPQADLDLADAVLASLTCPAETLAAQSSSCLGILDWGLVLFQRGAYRLRS